MAELDADLESVEKVAKIINIYSKCTGFNVVLAFIIVCKSFSLLSFLEKLFITYFGCLD